jgi:hypothetical protein
VDADRFASLRRMLDAGSRRWLLGAFSGTAVAAAPLALLSDAAAKKGKKKKKRCPACPAPLACAEACPSACDICFMRADAPVVCGGSQSDTECTEPCSSDDDCASPRPFCTLPQRVIRATGELTNPLCPGVPTPAGFCTMIPACP